MNALEHRQDLTAERRHHGGDRQGNAARDNRVFDRGGAGTVDSEVQSNRSCSAGIKGASAGGIG